MRNLTDTVPILGRMLRQPVGIRGISGGNAGETVDSLCYRGLAKTRLQHVAIAAVINLERLAAWFWAVPRAATRASRLAA
jgi:hypothetical protein